MEREWPGPGRVAPKVFCKDADPECLARAAQARGHDLPLMRRTSDDGHVQQFVQRVEEARGAAVRRDPELERGLGNGLHPKARPTAGAVAERDPDLVIRAQEPAGDRDAHCKAPRAITIGLDEHGQRYAAAGHGGHIVHGRRIGRLQRAAIVDPAECHPDRPGIVQAELACPVGHDKGLIAAHFARRRGLQSRRAVVGRRPARFDRGPYIPHLTVLDRRHLRFSRTV